ncbi:MAG: hypothetical protein U0169_02300 [Polyangiaceae bacterium]
MRQFKTGRLAVVVAIAGTLIACKKDEGRQGLVAAAAAAPAPPAPSVSAAPPAPPPAPKTPKELLEEHRAQLKSLASDGKYPEVCKGAPWINQTICAWVAARAEGRDVGRPDGELFRAFFTKEHWKHAYGRIVGDPSDHLGGLEVTVNGYRNHCLLDLDETRFSSRGRFDLWVQEQPETREVSLNSGSTSNWVVVEEMSLAKTLMDLAHSGGGLEARALAKNAIAMIATYSTYAERKGELPTIPSPGGVKVDAVAALPDKAAPLGTTPQGADSRAKGAGDMRPAGLSDAAKKQARSSCLSKCISACADDPSCERACATTKCPP